MEGKTYCDSSVVTIISTWKGRRIKVTRLGQKDMPGFNIGENERRSWRKKSTSRFIRWEQSVDAQRDSVTAGFCQRLRALPFIK